MTIKITDVLMGTRSEHSKRTREKTAARLQKRAAARFALARYLVTGLAERGLSLREKAELVETAIEGHLLSPLTPRSHEAIRQLEAQWKAGARSVSDYFEQPRTTRRKTDYDPRLVQAVTDAVLTSTYDSIRQLTLKIARDAATLADCGRVPKYDAVAAMVAAKGPVARVAYRCGSRAAELCATTHGVFVATHTHEAWSIDECKAEWHEAGWDPVTDEWVSVRPSIIMIRDDKSQVILGYHISDPLRRADEKNGRPMREGYDSADVFAALLAAASAEVSPAGTREFAGHLPDRLRWDNHSTHLKLGPILTELGRATQLDVTGMFLGPDPEAKDEGVAPADSGVSIARGRVRFPKSRGGIENLVGFAKRLCVDMEGHVDRVRPLDRATDDPVDVRTEAAANGDLATRQELLPPRALPTPAEQRLAFDARVRRYNHEHTNRVDQRTPASRYHEFARRTARKGRDLLLALPVRSGYAQGDGVVVYDNDIAYTFTTHVPGKFVIELGAAVTYRVDPLHRGIWADIDGKTQFLASKAAPLEPGRPQVLAQHAAAEARSYSDEAHAARAAAIDKRHGPGAAAGFKAEADAHLKLSRELANAVAAMKRAEERAAAAERALQLVAASDDYAGEEPSVTAVKTRKRSKRGQQQSDAAAVGGNAPAGTAAGDDVDAARSAFAEPPSVTTPVHADDSLTRADPVGDGPAGDSPAGDDPTVDLRVRRGMFQRGGAS